MQGDEVQQGEYGNGMGMAASNVDRNTFAIGS
jgi:hypothetical protein